GERARDRQRRRQRPPVARPRRLAAVLMCFGLRVHVQVLAPPLLVYGGRPSPPTPSPSTGEGVDRRARDHSSPPEMADRCRGMPGRPVGGWGWGPSVIRSRTDTSPRRKFMSQEIADYLDI